MDEDIVLLEDSSVELSTGSTVETTPSTFDPVTIVTQLITESTKLLTTAAVETTSSIMSTMSSTPGTVVMESSTIAMDTTSIPDASSITTTESILSTSTASSPITETLLFSWFDYTIFALLLLLSTFIGVYFGFLSKIKQNNKKEYLLGGKTMNKFPVSASLIASHISGITMLGVPSEMYSHGTQYWMFIIPAFTVALLMKTIYLPVFYDLQVTSAFTYLELRFDKFVRSAASLVYALQCIIYIPIVIYVPALAFSQVTGINLHVITPIICVICIFYTTVGGLRAVVWTDTLQFVLMIGACIAVIVLGISSVGGFMEVWEAADRGKRLIFFNMDPNPFVRTSFWTVCLGLTTLWVSNLAVNQGCVQRFLAVPDLRVAKNSLIIFTAGLIFVKSCSCFIGLLIYAKYESCDPFSIKKISKIDQILPYYIMDVGTKIPGLPGLFVSGIFSAALSTMSSVLNTLAGTIYEDFIHHRMPNASEKKASNIMKMLVVLLGFLVLGLVFVAERMGQVMHIAISSSGVTSGTMLGMFSAGMISRRINTKGIISASVVSMAITGTIMTGAQLNPKPPMLSLRTDGCDGEILANVTTLLTETVTQAVETDTVPLIFKLSFMHYSLLGLISFFVVSFVVSHLTGGGDISDERLLAPFLRNTDKLEKEMTLLKHNIKYEEIDMALRELQKPSDLEKK
ncbi:sodium-coupled monocarboxylate transporter 1-like [Anopheles stephensi]|uniref:Sodium/solute symporter n=1 Tax=Anopheles stephensi TaxID=30069 RepID=A0A182YR73_ANOST|nr:sodium-coupled monocarboxylate transporter 1-like [Anopheles stephensi]XP_035917652.1 sodium-coupled monocarboxylate transporter 1-like [Anopheles stephensi]XP_035917653.1 sodium-coupled monocarboxylate transporter 1-like [Anopheles stephensi]